MVWLWVPPLRGLVRYPVIRAYQYVSMVFAWLVLVGGHTMAAVTFIAGISAAKQTASVYSAMGNDESNSGLTIVFALLVSFYILVWCDFIFLSLRAAIEVTQVYLDIEDNTRSTANVIGRLRTQSRSKTTEEKPTGPTSDGGQQDAV